MLPCSSQSRPERNGVSLHATRPSSAHSPPPPLIPPGAVPRTGIELTESEFELVATRFATTMADGSPAVRWLDFIGAVEASSEPPRGIERDPLFEPVTHAVSASAKLRPPPAGQEALWTSLKARLRKQIAARSLLLRPTFDDFSKSGSARLVDHVTRTQFHQGLLSLGLLVNRAELDLLYHRYDTNRDSTVRGALRHHAGFRLPAQCAAPARCSS